MDFKAGDPRGCLVESGWAKKRPQLESEGRPSLQRTDSGAPSLKLQGEERLGGAVSGSAGSLACLGTAASGLLWLS